MPIYYRSGLSTVVDISAVVAAKEAVGGSLFYLNPLKNKASFDLLIEQTKTGQVFLDNGVISYCNQARKSNKTIEVPTSKQILDQYELIIANLTQDQAKNLAIVIPDDPICQKTAYDNIRQNKEQILRLINQCDAILPIHACHVKNATENLVEHAQNIFECLDYPDQLRIGIPAKSHIQSPYGNLKARLLLSEIESLLEIRNPRTKQRYLKKIHYLALSEATLPSSVLSDRLALCERYQIDDVTADGQRISAIMGNVNTSNRAGSIIYRSVKNEWTQENVKNSEMYRSYDYDSECDQNWMYDSCIDAITSDHQGFLVLWNNIISPDWPLDCKFNSDVDSVLAVFEDLVLNRMQSLNWVDLTQRIKSALWEEFTLEHHIPDSKAVRQESICRYFSSNNKSIEQTNYLVF